MPEVAPLDPERMVRVLAKHGVDYVLIGALAARLQGRGKHIAVGGKFTVIIIV